MLTPLGDVIWSPAPGDVLSIGDVLLYGGLAYSLVLVMRGRPGEDPRRRRCGSRCIGGSMRLSLGAADPLPAA